MNVSISLPGRRGRSVFGAASRRHAVLAGSIALLAWPASSALAAPNLSSVIPSNGPTVGNTSITLNGSSFSASGNEVKVDGEPCTIDTEGTTQIICRTPPGTGATNPTVVFDDTGAAGNSVNFAYNAPTMVSVNPSNGPTSGNTLLTISGTNFGASTADSVRTVTVGGQPCTLEAGLSSHGSILCRTSAGSGLSQVIAVTVDGQAATGSVSFHYDAPSISSVSPSNGPTTGANTLTLTGSNFGPSGNTVLVGGVNCPVTSHGTSSVECTAPAGTGTGKTVQLIVGGQFSNTRTYNYDAPTVSGVTPTNGPKAGGTTLTINGSNFGAAGTSRSISIGGVACPAAAPDSQSEIGCTLPAGQGTNLPVQVTVTGQSNSSGATFSYDAPSIASISPTNGPTTGNTPLTITGSNFSLTGNTIAVGSNACSPTFQSRSSIHCTLPEGTGAANDVTVHDAVGGGSNAANFAYDPPAISLVTPGNGPTAGGQVLTIVGSNFGPPSADADRLINLGGSGCLGLAGQSDHTMIRCTTPPGAGLDRSVTVSVDGQGSNSKLYDYDAPSITSIDPQNGPTAGSVPLTIRGLNFAPDLNGNSASVGGSACTVTDATTTEIVCDLPEGTGTGRIVSMGAAGQAAVGPLFHYDPPVVSLVTPSNGPKIGGTVITLSGQNFGAAGTVRNISVSGSPCPAVPGGDGHTAVACTLPAGQGTSLAVAVTVDGQSNSGGATFSYDAPAISSISSESGPTGGGIPLTINGSDFSTTGNTVSVGGAACPPTAQSSSQILCTLPEGTGASNDVMVIDAVGGSSSAANFAYDPPAISSITPGNGPTAGGSVLTIVGSNFGAVGADGVRTINLGGSGCLGLAGQSDHTMIRCTVPAGAGVDRSVTVSVDGQGSNSYLYDYDAPSITSIDPQNGPTAGSVPLTIRGLNFAPDLNGNSASVGGSACTVTDATTTEIVCDLPEGTGPGRIVSMDAAGQGAVGPLFHYDPPVVSSVTPSNGPTAGNVPITINGLNFGAAGADSLRSATVGTAECPLLPSSSSHTSIVCTLPEGQGLGNTVHVVVDTQPSNNDSFGYDAPLISSITPASPPAAGNVPITVQGANFGLSATATVGGQSCPVVEQTHSSLTCTLPAGSGSSVPVLVTVSGQVGLSSLDYKTPLCGDGVNDTDEDCDDSNSDDLDGCSARCETEDSQDKDQAGCIVGLNKSGAGVAKAQGRAVLACAKDAAVGVTCIGASTVPEGVAKASAKVTSTFDKKCQSLPDFGPVDAAVVSQAAIDQDLALAHAIFGADPDAALVPDAMNPARSDCQQDVIAATEKLMGAGLKAFGKCKKDGLKEETIRATSQLGACLGFVDEDSKWDKAAARVSSVLTDSCAGVDLAAALPGECASAPDKGACLEGRVLCHTCHLLVIGDNLDEDCDLIDDLTDNGSCD